jgi:hypothetical protein
MNMPSHDAQREMEQRALRNVRGLVDKMEDHDRLDAAKQRRVVYGLVGGIALAIAIVVALVIVRNRVPPTEVVIPPPSGAPAAPTR